MQKTELNVIILGWLLLIYLVDIYNYDYTNAWGFYSSKVYA